MNLMLNFSFFTFFFIILNLYFHGCPTLADISSLSSPSPSVGGFASGTIDLGGLLIRQVSTFNQIWAEEDGGPDNLGATFYQPSSIPQGFFALGSYIHPNNVPLSGHGHGHIVVAKDVTNDPSNPILKPPIDYALLWTSNASKINQDGGNYGIGHIWIPTPSQGYKTIGYVVTNSSRKPSREIIRCVRSDYTDDQNDEHFSWVWGQEDGFNVYGSRPHDMAISTGTFVAQHGGVTTISACLKNLNGNLAGMPNLDQIKSLVQTYSPVIYFHPDEEFLPSTVDWFFQNGALLYKKGQESSPTRIDPSGSNLPWGGSNDDSYWLDLPIDGPGKDRVSKGNLQTAGAYLHAKVISEGTYTDIQIWVFYPYNGAARAKVKFINIGLGKIGEHVGDWEHVTLRINNFNGELSSVFFSQHSGGQWVDASQLEYASGKKPVVYASLHGHAAYPKPGLVLLGSGGGIGVRDDTTKSSMVMDTGVNYVVVAAEYLGVIVVEPPWLNYARKWGPKIDYDLDNEIRKAEKLLPDFLRKAFDKLVRGIPPEVLGEDGPTGPKMKDSWNGDERSWA